MTVGQQHRILLIDDEPTVVRDTLDVFGYDVDVATDGYSGVHQLSTNPYGYSLIILDLNMPVMDGWATLKCIRQGHDNPTIPVLIMTSEDADSLAVNGLRRGADEYLVKPVPPATLLARVEAILRRVEWTRESAQRADGKPDGLHESFHLLTPRERELLQFLARGYTNNRIGDTLGITETTVKNHLAHIFKKLKVSNRTEAAYIAQKLDVV
ncbi:MAG: response regulator transcription factor [Vampirovibrionales bacterium]|nr:response regulator transcription factor [Vampirovibrionales bacterium]